MTYPQLPRIPHCTRAGPVTGQPFRWAIIHNEHANGEAAFFADGVLLGWQGWDTWTIGGPVWRYWDGDLVGRRIFAQQYKLSGTSYEWRISWWQAHEEYPIMMAYRQTVNFGRDPWGNLSMGAPWLVFTPSGNWAWLPTQTDLIWYRTAQEALAEFPDCLRQDDYLETFGESLWIPD